MVALTVAVTIAIAIAISIAVAVAVAITHRHCRCRRPLPLRLPSTIAAAMSVALPSAIAVAVALAIGHCRLRHRCPSQLPSQLAITVAMPLAISCCLGSARIVFNQLKHRMLTSFYFVCTVGGALIKAGWLTRCQAAMANTSVGWRVTSSERLVREVAGSRGEAGGQQGGNVDWPWEVLFCSVVGVGYQPLTDSVCDDVLDVVEDITGETVIELMQEQNNIRERYDSDKKMYT
jgi:hypothetical protein